MKQRSVKYNEEWLFADNLKTAKRWAVKSRGKGEQPKWKKVQAIHSYGFLFDAKVSIWTKMSRKKCKSRICQVIVLKRHEYKALETKNARSAKVQDRSMTLGKVTSAVSFRGAGSLILEKTLE